jgi:hypothetical protein
VGLRPITKHNCKKGVPHGNFVEARLLLCSIQLTMFVEDNWILERQTLSLSGRDSSPRREYIDLDGMLSADRGPINESGPVTVGVNASEGS